MHIRPGDLSSGVPALGVEKRVSVVDRPVPTLPGRLAKSRATKVGGDRRRFGYLRFACVTSFGLDNDGNKC